MPTPLRTALAALLLSAAAAAPAQAQGTQPAVPAVTTQGETQDSGVGGSEPAGWIGMTAVTSDDREIGTIRDVRIPSDTADSGVLLVDYEGRTLEVPVLGAAASGSRVVVTPTYERLTAE